jgi:succinate dehydrogenase / fumarate reductase, flavoprotein subunit
VVCSAPRRHPTPTSRPALNAHGYDVIECDVLVVGAGGAGLRAAIAAAEAGCRTYVVSKSLLGKAHTVMAEGGAAAALGNVDPRDSWEVHFADTMLGGQMVNNWRMVELFAHEAIDRVYELERWGGIFDRTTDGKISQRPFGAHTYSRLCHVGDRTGLELIRTCQDRLVHTPGVDVGMEHTLTELLKDGDRIVGATGYRRTDGSFVIFRAKAIILATGGWGRMYRCTSNSWEGTGDGAAMAYRAGAELVDMEFVQFHPTGMIWPPGARGILVTEAVRGEGGRLYNALGERFMETYDAKKMELSSRDVVARAIYQEVQAGRGSPRGGAFLDIRHRGADYIKRKLPSMHEQFAALAGVDITTDAMEVGPTIHYTMGGVRVDPESGATTVAGLFAAGEVTGGLHGANRLGGNSLSDILVFGKRAGEGAAAYALAHDLGSIDDADVAREQADVLGYLATDERSESPYRIHDALQAAMQDDAGIARTETSLERSLQAILELKVRAEGIGVSGGRVFNPGWHACRDVVNMLTISEAIVRSAIERRESRGAHWRLDHPETSEDQGSRNYVVYQSDPDMGIRSEAVQPLPVQLQRHIDVELAVRAINTIPLMPGQVLQVSPEER